MQEMKNMESAIKALSDIKSQITYNIGDIKKTVGGESGYPNAGSVRGVVKDGLLDDLYGFGLYLKNKPGYEFHTRRMLEFVERGKRINTDYSSVLESFKRKGADPRDVYIQKSEFGDLTSNYLKELDRFIDESFAGGSIDITDYPKIYRFPIGPKVISKDYMSKEEAMEILDGEVVIEEKVDGKTDSKDIGDHRVFGEFLKWQHSINYDQLPDYFLSFDVWCKKEGRFLGYDEKISVLEENGMPYTSLVYRGEVKELLDLEKFLGKSKFAEDQWAEGIVVKNYKKQMFGKLVRSEFLEGITDHWMTKEKKMNRLSLGARK